MVSPKVSLLRLLGVLGCTLVQLVLAQSPAPCSPALQSQGCQNCTLAPNTGGQLTCSSCGPFKFYNRTAETCQECFTACVECTSTVSCQQCTFGYFVTPANQTRQQLGYRHTCSPCNVSNCLNCTDETTCNFCSVGYTLDLEAPGTCKYRLEEWANNAKSAVWNFVTLVFIFCILTALGVFGWFFWDKHQTKKHEAARRRAQQTNLPAGIAQTDQRQRGQTAAEHSRTNIQKLAAGNPEESNAPLVNKLPKDQLDGKVSMNPLEAEKIEVELAKIHDKTLDGDDEAI